MDILWSPWRYRYITGENKNANSDRVCVFCSIAENPARDEENYVLHRADFNFVVLNIYPYISGHLMIIPYVHQSLLEETSKETSDELMDLTKHCQRVLNKVYQPQGINLGMNLGKAAGAGVAEHLHMHILPRWIGDANFMTSIAETRTIPEDLATTYTKLKNHF